MHDDQHGTAIISSAALLNALILVNKKIEEIVLVVNGGAAAVSCSRLYMALGLKKENLIMCDSKGVINKERKGLRCDQIRICYFTETQHVARSDERV